MSLDKIVTDSLANGAINASSIAVNSIPSSRLTTTGVVANSYGNSSQIPVITIDAAGRISNATVTAVAGVTNFTYESGNNAFRIATGDGSSFAANLPYRTDQNLRTTDVVQFGNTTINGNLTVTGVVTTVNTVNLSVQDNMIYLNANSVVSNPDLGFVGNYNDGSYAHAGLFRDATDARWKVFDGYLPEPDASPYIDTANASFHLADLQANVVYANVTGNVTGNVSGSANSATYLGGNTASDLNTYASTAAGTAYTNAVSQATTLAGTAYSNAVSTAASDATTKAGTAYSNAVSQATTLAGTAYSNAVSTAASDATTKAGTAYSNAVSYAGTIAGTAYSNAVSVAATDATNKAANAYANAVTYADNKVANLVNSAPAALDTLLELAAALGNDANFSTTVTTGIGNAYTNAVSQATTLAGTAYSNAVSYAGTIAGTAYTNATSYAATIAGTAYSNATTFASNASNISSGTLSAARLPQANSTSNGAVLILDSVSNTATSIYAAAPNSVKTAYELAGNAVSNAVSYAATAYSNATSYAATIAGTAYSNAVSVASSDATSKAATAYSNATSYAATIAGTAYSNATSYAATIAGTAYSNAVSYAASNSYVNSTFLPLAGGTMTGSVANATFSTKTIISGYNADTANTADSGFNGILGLRGLGSLVRLNMGVQSASPYGSWIQSSYDNGGGANGVEPLLLNPVGGLVTIASNTSLGYALGVNGSFATNDQARAPIFYDYSDTNYFVDPASSTSAVLAGSVGIGTSSPVNTAWGSSSNTKQIYVSSNNYSVINLRADTLASTYYSMGAGDGRFYAAYDNNAGVHRLTYYGSYVGINNVTTPSYNIHLTGTGYASSDWRAPIFYDSDNTSYYVNPASTTILSELKVGTGPGGSTAGNLYINGNYSWRWIAGYSPSYGVGNGFGLYSDTIGAYLLSLSTSGYWYFGSNNHDSSYRVSINGTGYATGDFRAPIFYDSNDTNYYCDPNGSSVFSTVYNLGKIYTTNPSNYSTASVTSLTTAPITTQNFNPSAGTTGQFFPLTHQTALYSSGYNTHVSTGVYKDANGWQAGWYMAIGGNDSYPTQWYQLRYDNLITHSDGYLRIAGSTRSPLFYDLDDTGYYVDPRSASVLSGLKLNGVDNNASGEDAILWINKPNNNDWALIITGALDYGIEARMAASHTYAYRALANGSEYYRVGTDLLYHNSQMRAPTFYDYDDTGFYTNPSSNSRVVGLIVGGHGGTAYNTASSGRLYFGTSADNSYSIYTHMEDYGGNYTKLTLDWHTGIKIGAYSSYGGIRFYNNSINSSGTEVFSVAKGDSNVRVVNGLYASIFYDLDNSNYYADIAGTSAFNAAIVYGEWKFKSNMNTATGSSPPLQAYSDNNSYGAMMSFHRSSQYAINFGLDSDNVIRFGGWSASANRLQMDMSGNLTMAGNVTAYSDIRLKENIEVIANAVSKVKQIRGVTYTRNDDENKTKRHAGVIAQEVEVVLPEVVSEDNSGIKNVAYGNMVGLLIEAIKEQQNTIDRLEALVNSLINKTGD